MTDQASQQAAVSERKAAEQEYSITAFDYVRNPVGSRDWTLYWDGWQAAIKHAQQAVESDRDNLEGMAESMRMFRADMIKAGVVGDSVPPMFMTEAILGAIGAARDKATEEAASICDDLSKLYTEPVGFDEGYSMASKRAASEIRNFKSQQPAQADKPDIESTRAARAIAAYEASGATTPWTYLDPAEWSKWEKIADAVHAIAKG